jgi:hypothetical protein
MDLMSMLIILANWLNAGQERHCFVSNLQVWVECGLAVVGGDAELELLAVNAYCFG